ncbi:hypothetical protein QBC46DRAFT_461338 [Diplogelasinospora grovesii]|uniref:Peptidase C14 caspase domain-containing protein n=1 Tax=Diplogelasinospora grovesii TaxID=303347 RepID=A0AAN6N171_9PEZI|nr:hypothetical protein QBC46DRAFT_461338 [Diplogelasinospora grovesii]
MDSDGPGTTVTRYAILIGINAYPEKPLKGCVRDVQNIKTYLEGVSSSIRIQIFTAAESDSLGTGDHTLRPTYCNVTRAFEETTKSANPGDLVYIHFSGHGVRGRRCIFMRLARSLKPMVDKGLVVTLVLDCCFAGSVYRRDDPTVRCLPYDANADSTSPLDPVEIEGAFGPSSRDASMQPNWLINPDGYTILAACGPHEEATEHAFDDGQAHGVLSYYLLEKALKGYGGLGKRHRHVYAYLRATLRNLGWPSPVLYGNQDRAFFEHLSSEANAAVIPIIKRQDGNLELQVGRAHGVSCDDQFELYPLSAAGQASGSRENTILAKVTQVRALTSDLNRLDTTSTRVQTGWMASSVTRLSLRAFPIRLPHELPHREEWRIALEARSLALCIGIDQQPYAFHVVLNSNKKYEIQDGSDQRLLNLPSMPQDQTDVCDICGVLEHLARFTLVRELSNKEPTDFSRKSFRAQVIRRDDSAAFDPGCPVEVKHSEKEFTFELRVENTGEKTLYVSIYDMGPCWQVDGILCQTYEEVTPQRDGSNHFSGVFSKKLRTMVPTKMREEGSRQCKDVIKVFVTSQPTSFDILELPEFGKLVKQKSTTRAGREAEDSSEEWAALNFPICTSLI